ncbi:hypothetical protein AALA13_15710 [Lachnospiraceae bacterium 50-23]|jgi:hypothetical protein|nr:hypothetical protein [Dorea sp.]
MKKKLCILFAAISLTMSLPFGMDVHASDSNTAGGAAASSPEIAPRKVGYEWKYKIINGVLYKRLYSHDLGIWIGNWVKA